MPGGDIGDDLVAIGVVKVERLVEEVISRARDFAGQVGVKGVVVLELAAARALIDAVSDQGALARHVL